MQNRRRQSFVRLAAALTAAVLAGSGAAAAERAPATFPARSDFAALDRLVGERQFVIFGEDSHGMGAVHELAPKVFEHLVREKGFRLFVFESAWGLEEALQSLVDGSAKAPTPEQSFFLNAFNSPPIQQMLAWIGEWNRAHPADPVRIAGYQPEQPVTDVRAIRAYFAALRPGEAAAVETALAPCKAGDPKFRTNIEFIGAMGAQRRKDKLPAFTAEERQACLDGIAATERRLGPGGGRTEAETRLHLLSLKTYVDVMARLLDDMVADGQSQPPPAFESRLYDEGDRVRFEIFEGLRGSRYGKAKAFLWMHNWHAMRQAQEVDMAGARAPSLATRMAQRYPSRTVSIGSIVPCDARCTDGPESLELAFKAKFGDRAAVVDFRDRKASAGLPLDKPGVLVPNLHGMAGGGFKEVVLRRQFDGVIYLPKGDSTR